MVAFPTSQAGRRKPTLQMADEGRLWKSSGRIEGAGSRREQDEESGPIIANYMCIGQN